MKRINFFLILAIISTFGAHGQRDLFPDLQEKWIEYRSGCRNIRPLQRAHFNDSVSTEEMKEAFYKYKDTVFSTKPDYEELDTVENLLSSSSAIILSPLKRHPKKEIRECKGYWLSYRDYKLGRLWDRKGRLRKDLVQELNDTREEWLDGEIIELREPRWYMGFLGSPRLRQTIFIKGKWVGGEGIGPDFFSYAHLSLPHYSSRSSWYTFIGDGARLLGQLHGMYSDANLYHGERTFSVLLYDNSEKLKSRDRGTPYRLVLLEPQEPDKETTELFDDFKQYVERIPEHAFKPYYTTDFRIMTGRYFRVTVNKCGWLVEDYLTINSKWNSKWNRKL